jgi:hypothetical protein
MSEQPVDAENGEDVLEVRGVEAHRLEIIDAVSGGRFHHAMSDQRFRAQTFERLLRWQRMRHELMDPILLPDDPELEIDLRAVIPSVELPAHRPEAVS